MACVDSYKRREEFTNWNQIVSNLSKHEVSFLAKHKTPALCWPSLLSLHPSQPMKFAGSFHPSSDHQNQGLSNSPFTPHPTPHFTKTTLAEITPMLSSYVSLLTTLLVKCYPWMVFLATFLPWLSSNASGCRRFAGGFAGSRAWLFPSHLKLSMAHSSTATTSTTTSMWVIPNQTEARCMGYY